MNPPRVTTPKKSIFVYVRLGDHDSEDDPNPHVQAPHAPPPASC